MEVIKPKLTSGDCVEMFSHPRSVSEAEGESDQAVGLSKHWTSALSGWLVRSDERFKSMRLFLHSLLLSAV